ncbi:hypothetical protein EYZ11_003195 [Aspergillus tanneri]|uniref:Extracellular membrane protein CFEM domain-containing protein n=1 Tax=Aspergillus tanneri TaxID=1220188 RepID=A0A4V3UQ19_9EURO|nr:uncharacterized protein ATNIH1004_010339 [Aspergillus tanneri]KAA8643570.1 hypothetical protein ATNIH1004_010339 [Aspergillus tanneri]THC97304.1 hypothetical protein EYZ11_003195 [Aspergillus tanneri]
MKLNVLALTTLLGLAVAQSSTSGPPAASTSLTAQESCAKRCDDKDLCCKAQCYKVPCPSDSQANDTISCVAACPQGTGSPSDTEKYASCQSSCYSSHFFPATQVGSGSQATHASSNDDSKTTGTDSGSKSTATGESGSKASGSSSSTGTSSGSEASESPNAAALKLGVSTAGVVGLVLGALAL